MYFSGMPQGDDGQDWDGSDLLELLPKCDILIAARNCKALGLDIPPTMLALADEVIVNLPLRHSAGDGLPVEVCRP